MNEILLDGTTITSMTEIHRTLADALSFPEWYGGTLDALHDCLCELSENTCITLRHTDELSETLGPAFPRLCRVLLTSAEENPYLKIQL